MIGELRVSTQDKYGRECGTGFGGCNKWEEDSPDKALQGIMYPGYFFQICKWREEYGQAVYVDNHAAGGGVAG